MDDLQSYSQEAAILSRVIAPSEGNLSLPAAKALADLEFSKIDVQRMNELAEKNRLGQASEAELSEIEGYSRVGNLLNLLQSKARQSLNNGNG